METIQVVIDSKLLQATNRAARRAKLNRSAFVRDALQAHLTRLATRELEDRERRGYERQPQREDELIDWKGVAAWPEE